MTKIMTGKKYLRDIGQGLADHVDQAHEFSDDEAWAFTGIHSEWKAVGDVNPKFIDGRGMIRMADKPSISPGENRVWVFLNGRWLSADKQDMIYGTRNALRAAAANVPLPLEPSHE